jgi:amyloid beta precursor protein binding protein 1
LESARVLVIGASATATSILKNLVLPGIGHITLLDHCVVSPADAGNNFFFEGSSIGRNRAEEAVYRLAELNDSVQARADTRDVADVLASDQSYFFGFSLIITHNIAPVLLKRLADLLWSNPSSPPLIPVRSAGFLAEFFVQFHTHEIIESHTEDSTSLRIDKPFPALLQAARELKFDAMDTTDHGHIPYVYILVRALDDWKTAHDGLPPQTYAEKQEFKSLLNAQKRTLDEENFDEAVAQSYRAWTPTITPPHLVELFADTTIPSTPFGHLLAALQSFSRRPPHVLPLSVTLPDMKSDTESYVRLQNLYRTQAAEEREQFRALLRVPVQNELVDLFVKNAHGVQLLKGACYGALDATPEKLTAHLGSLTRETATHLAFFALDAWRSSPPRQSGGPTDSELREHIVSLVPSVELDEKEISDAVGEIIRAPTADLPNVAAFLGGIVAQEAIKMITRQYIPVNGYCVIDLVDTWTGVLPS